MTNDSSVEPRKGDKRLWVKLYLDFLDDPDLMEAGIETELLFVRGLAWGKRKNDGFIARGSLIRLGLGLTDAAVCVNELVKRGLWQVVDNGWQIKNWDEFQVSDTQLEIKRAAGVLANHHRWHKERPSPNCVHCSSVSDATRMQKKEKELEKEINISQPDGFDQFWIVYPRKVGIADARKAWKQTAKERPGLESIVAAVHALVAEKREPRFIPHPATWLRGHRWADHAEATVVSEVVLRPCSECVGTGRADYGGDEGKEVCRACNGERRVAVQ